MATPVAVGHLASWIDCSTLRQQGHALIYVGGIALHMYRQIISHVNTDSHFYTQPNIFRGSQVIGLLTSSLMAKFPRYSMTN